MTHAGSPVAQQRRLRSELRRARERAKLTQKEVADAFGWHPSKLIRLEAGAVSIDVADLLALLHHYEVTDERKIAELVAAARASKEHAWWDEYRKDFSSEFITYLGYEAAAIRLRQFQSLIIPGILQMPAYADAVVRLFSSDENRVDRGVQVRLERQKIVESPNAPEMFFVLDEAAVRRQVGGVAVMGEQLQRLKALAERPNISMQVVPFSAGAHVGMKGSFTIFEFAGDDEDFVAYSQQTFRDVLVKTSEETSSYVESFYDLEQAASRPEDFAGIVDEIQADLER
jgi:transcriptional regulator with XRE-family HTH domain